MWWTNVTITNISTVVDVIPYHAESNNIGQFSFQEFRTQISPLIALITQLIFKFLCLNMLNGTDDLLEGWKELFKKEREEPYSSKVIFAVSLLVVFISSLVGNILICIVIYYNKTMHTATNFYLFDLAVSDLLITFQVLIVIYQILTPVGLDTVFEQTSGVLTCQIYICIQSVFLSLLWNHGTLVITALSIERYIAICCPMMLLSTPVWKRVCKIIFVLWVIAITETLPLFWTFDFVDTGTTLRCSILLTTTAKIITVVSVVISFIIPLGIIIYMYAMIVFEVKNHHKLNKMVVHNSILKRKYVNSLIIALMVSFVVCWLPNYFMWILLYFTDKRTVSQFQWWFTMGHKIAVFNSWFATVLNPLLFSLISIKFRKALKMLWDQQIKRRCFQTKKNAIAEKKQQNLHSVSSQVKI